MRFSIALVILDIAKDHRSRGRKQQHHTSSTERLDYETFRQIVSGDQLFLEKIFSGGLVVPEFISFCNDIADLFDQTTNCNGGDVASYIPQLAKVNPDMYAVSLCTIDGQRFSVGDYDI